MASGHLPARATDVDLPPQPSGPSAGAPTFNEPTGATPVHELAARYIADGERPDFAAVHALADAARAGRAPQRAAVCARDGHAPLSRIQERSYKDWVGGALDAAAPTTAALRSDFARRNRLLGDPAELELAELLAADKRLAKPCAQDPYALCAASGNPQLAPSLLSDAPLPPRRQPPAPGKLQTLDPAAFFSAHAALCDRCGDSPPRRCYGPSLARTLGGIEWPWKDGAPPPQAALSPAFPDPPYCPKLEADVLKLLGLGVVYEPADATTILHYSNIFPAQKVEIILTQDEQGAYEAHGPQAACAAAAARASAFTQHYTSGLAASTQPPSNAVVREAWDAAAAAAMGDTKARLVINMGALTPHFAQATMRYGRLREYLDGLKPGMYQIKLDCEKGFYLLPLSWSASLYAGFKIRFSDGRVASLCFSRLPMGCHPAPHLFSCVSAEANTQLGLLLPREIIPCKMSYVDDFFAAAAAKSLAETGLVHLRHLLEGWGALVSNAKTSVEASMKQVNLGILTETDHSEGVFISLPAAKAVKALSLFMALRSAALSSTPVPARALASAAGLANNWAAIEADIPCHTPLIMRWFSAGFGAGKAWLPGTYKWDAKAPLYIAELDWLIHQARSGRLMGSRVQHVALAGARPTLCFSVDAGPDAICISSELGTLRILLPGCSGVLIAIMELLSPVIIFMIYGRLLQGMIVDVASDALGACGWAMSRRSKRGDANDLFKLLGASTHSLDAVFVQRWLTRWHNFRSDRGAGLPLAQWATLAGLDMGFAAEITLEGLPCEFLKAMAEEYYPSMAFDTAAWQQIHARG